MAGERAGLQSRPSSSGYLGSPPAAAAPRCRPREGEAASRDPRGFAAVFRPRAGVLQGAAARLCGAISVEAGRRIAHGLRPQCTTKAGKGRAGPAPLFAASLEPRASRGAGAGGHRSDPGRSGAWLLQGPHHRHRWQMAAPGLSPSLTKITET